MFKIIVVLSITNSLFLTQLSNNNKFTRTENKYHFPTTLRIAIQDHISTEKIMAARRTKTIIMHSQGCSFVGDTEIHDTKKFKYRLRE